MGLHDLKKILVDLSEENCTIHNLYKSTHQLSNSKKISLVDYN